MSEERGWSKTRKTTNATSGAIKVLGDHGDNSALSGRRLGRRSLVTDTATRRMSPSDHVHDRSGRSGRTRPSPRSCVPGLRGRGTYCDPSTSPTDHTETVGSTGNQRSHSPTCTDGSWICCGVDTPRSRRPHLLEAGAETQQPRELQGGCHEYGAALQAGGVGSPLSDCGRQAGAAKPHPTERRHHPRRFPP